MSTRVRKIAMLRCKLTLAANIQRNALRVAAVSELIQFSILIGMATQEIFSTWRKQDRRLALTTYDLKRVCATIQPTQTSKHNSPGFSILMRLHWKVLYRSLRSNLIALDMNKTCTTAQWLALTRKLTAVAAYPTIWSYRSTPTNGSLARATPAW